MAGRGYLDAAQGQAASHPRLYILILELVQEAKQSLGKGRRADLARQWEPETPTFASGKACLTLTRSRKTGPRERLRSWVLTAAMTLLLPWTSSELRARSPSLRSRPSGASLRAFKTTAWSSEFKFCTSNTARKGGAGQGGASWGGVFCALLLPPTPSDPPTGSGHFCEESVCLTLLSRFSHIGLHGGALQGFDITPELEDGELLSGAWLGPPGQLLPQGILQELDTHCGRQCHRPQGWDRPRPL